MAVGGGGAFTGGVNRLPPVGLIDFSVGATVGEEGAPVVVVVVVVVVVSGAFCSSLAQDAVKPTIATTAPPPITAATRRAIRPDFIMQSSQSATNASCTRRQVWRTEL